MDIAAWLNNLGLGHYETAFRDNAIDADLLPSLTAEDLKDLGVTIVGHRRKLLDAIAALGAASKTAPPPSAAGPPATLPPPALSSRPQPRSGADAERRPITVMFCDLVGSTALAAQLDAEDWRNLVSGYLDEASAAVTGLGGHVLKRLGDGLMALFGYPQAQENDAERAVRAALAIQRALAELNARKARTGAPELSARIGLECGSWWSMRPARCLATRRTSPRACRRRPSRARCSSPRTFSARSPVFSSPKTRARRTQGRAGAGQPLSHRARERRRSARRGARPDAIRRPRGGTCAC